MQHKFKLIYGLAILIALFTSSNLWASSTILDGVIVKIDGEKILINAEHTPYSSVSATARLMTPKGKPSPLWSMKLSQFSTWYIDEVPVTKDQFKAVLRPGLRLVTMENRNKWYFVQVSLRNPETRVGFIHAIKGNVLTIERHQIATKSLGVYKRDDKEKKGLPKARIESDGYMHLTYAFYPNLKKDITLDDNAVVIRQGKKIPWRKAGLRPDLANAHADVDRSKPQAGGGWNSPTREVAKKVLRKRNSVLLQAARKNMRIELIPDRYGDWHNLVNEQTDSTKDRNKVFAYQMRNQCFGIITSTVSSKKVDIARVIIPSPKW